MRILLVAQFYPPEVGAAAVRLHGLARWLVRFGHQVTVLTGLPNYPMGEVPKEYRRRLYVRERLDGVEVIRTWIYASKQRSSLRRLVNYFSFVASGTIAGALGRGRYDVVVASSPPLFVGLVGHALAKRYGIPWVLDVRDIWPDVAVEMQQFAPEGRMTAWTRRLARFLYRSAEHITPVTQRKCEKLRAQGTPPEKLTVVSNGVDLDLLGAATNGDWRGTLGLGDQFVVVYAGLIGFLQGVDKIVEAAALLRDRPNIHFVIAGDGVQRDEVLRQAHALRLRNVTFVPLLPHGQVPSLLRSADVVLVPLVNGRVDDTVPYKLLEAWGCKRPAILMAAGEAAQLMSEAKAGVVIPPAEPRQLADILERFAGQRARLEQCGLNGYRFVKAHFERESLARQMEAVLRRVTNGDRRRQPHKHSHDRDVDEHAAICLTDSTNLVCR